MTHETAPRAAEETRPEQEGNPLRRRVQTLVALAVAGLTVATVWALKPPDRTFEAGYGIELKRATGHRIWTVLEHGSTAAPGTIEIDDIEPRITRDGAAVTVDYAVCHLDSDALAAEKVDGFGYGLSDRFLRRYCTRHRPAEGASMRLGTDPAQELLVGVTPTRPGRSVIPSHRIEFREGWRHGTAEILASVDIEAR